MHRPDLAAPHFGKRAHAAAAIDLVGLALLALGEPRPAAASDRGSTRGRSSTGRDGRRRGACVTREEESVPRAPYAGPTKDSTRGGQDMHPNTNKRARQPGSRRRAVIDGSGFPTRNLQEPRGVRTCGPRLRPRGATEPGATRCYPSFPSHPRRRRDSYRRSWDAAAREA
jgi:hypothetical protein